MPGNRCFWRTHRLVLPGGGPTHQNLAIDEIFFANGDPNLAAHAALHVTLPFPEPVPVKAAGQLSHLICDFDLRVLNLFVE